MSDDEDERPKRVMKTTEVKINDNMDVIQKRAKDVEAFLSKSNGKDALLTAIADPPLGSKNEQAKDVSFLIWFYHLGLLKGSENSFFWQFC
jgi:hypothetical protein